MSAVEIFPSNSSLHQHHPPFPPQYQSHSHPASHPLPHPQSHSPPKSPVAPSYSPITPKASIVLPVASPHSALVRPPDNDDFSSSHNMPVHEPESDDLQSKMSSSSTAHFIPQPPNLPFSAEDSSDAIALRAAISTLQYQKHKAQDDLKALESMKKLALGDPEHFTAELRAGRLTEVKTKVLSSMRPLDEGEEDSDDDDDEKEEPVALGAEREEEEEEEGIIVVDKKSHSPPPRTEIPESQPSQASTVDASQSAKFPKIPGAQEVIRTPYINWEKYGVVGTPLDSMHAQQQRWPGSTNFTNSKGREHAVAAPYSPFLDELEDRREGQDDTRRDSGPQPSLTGTISEHVMSTRSRN